MKFASMVITILGASLFLTGCSTHGNFRIPNGTTLYVHKRPNPVTVESGGSVTTQPFFWTAAGSPPRGGIHYRLEKDGNVVKQGRLRTKFRVVSVFWPPFAMIYWPMGFNPDITYDLVTDKQE